MTYIAPGTKLQPLRWSENDLVETPSPGDSLKQSYSIVNNINPDQAANDIKASNSVGVQYSSVFNDPDMLKQVHQAVLNKKTATTNWNGIAQNYPKTTQFLSNPQNMAVSHDDISNVAQHEGAFQWLNDTWNGIKSLPEATGLAFKSGWNNLLKTTSDFMEAQARANEQEAFDAAGMAGGKQPQNANKGSLGAPNSGNPVYDPRIQKTEKQLANIPQKYNIKPGGIGSFISQNVPQVVKMVPGLVASWLAKSPYPMMSYAGVTSFADTYSQAKLQGAPDGAAITAAFGSGEMNAALSKVPVEMLMRPSSSFLEKMATQGVTQGIIGWLGEGLQSGIEKGTINPNLTLSDALQRMDNAGQGGAFTGVLLAGLAHPLEQYQMNQHELNEQQPMESRMKELSRQMQMTQNSAAFNQAIGQAARESKLLQRLPDAYEDALGQLKQDTPVDNAYIPKEAFDQYFQSKNIDPAAVADELGIADQYKERAATNEDLSIPYETYVRRMAPTEHFDGLANDIKFSPDGLTGRQVIDELQSIHEVLGKKVAEMTPEEQTKAIYNDHLTGLLNRAAYDEMISNPETRLPFQSMLDLNGFKFINDSLGHEAGDALLQNISRLMEQSDIGPVFRQGGDEFTFQSNSLEEAQAKAQKLQSLLDKSTIELEDNSGQKIKLNGVTFGAGHGEEIKSADAGLEANKREQIERGIRPASRGDKPPGLHYEVAAGREVREDSSLQDNLAGRRTSEREPGLNNEESKINPSTENQAGFSIPEKNIDEVARKVGFKDAAEAHLAFVAKEKGFKDFVLESGKNPEKALPEYRKLRDKLDALPEEDRNNLKVDLQFFAAGNKGKEMTYEDYQNKEKMQDLNDKWRQRNEELKGKSLAEKQAAVKKAKTQERWKGLLDVQETKENAKQKFENAKYKAQEKLDEVKQEGRDRLVKLKDKIFDQKVEEKQEDSYENLWNRLLSKNDKVIGKIKNMAQKVDDLRPEFRKPLKAALEPFTTFNPDSKKGLELQKIADYVKNNPDNNLPQKLLDRVGILDRKSIFKLSPGELQDVHDVLAHYIHLNKLKNKLIREQTDRVYDVVGNEAAKRVIAATDDAHKVDAMTSSGKVKIGKQPGLAGKFLHGLIRTDLIAQRIDNEKNGPIKTTFFDKGKETLNKTLGAKQGFFDTMNEAIKQTGADVRNWSEKFNTKGKNVERVPVHFEQDGGNTRDISKAELIAFYLNSKDSYNRAGMLKAGITFENQPNRVIKVTEGDIKGIVGSMNPEEIAVAEAISRIYNGPMKDAINETSLKHDGYEIATRDNYYHYNISRNELGLTPEEVRNNPYAVFNAENQGFLKERTAPSKPIEIRDAFQGFVDHAKGVAAYHGMTDYVHDTAALLNHPAFKNSMEDFDGGYTYNYLKQYVKDMQGGRNGIFDETNRAYQTIMQHAIRATLGLNPTSYLKHWSSWIMEMNYISPKYLADAVNLPWRKTDSKEIISEINQHSPQLRQALEGSFSPETGELGQTTEAKHIFVGDTTLQDAKDLNFDPALNKTTEGFNIANRLKVLNLWKAVKAETLKEHPELQGDAFWQHVADRTEEIFSRSNTIGSVKDRPSWFRSDNTVAKTLSLFQSFGNTCLNELYRAGMDYQQSGKSLADKADFTKRVALTGLCMSIVPAAIGAGWKEITGQKQSKMPMALQAVNNMVEAIPVVGQGVAAVLEGAFNGTNFQDLSTLPLEVLNTIYHAGYDVSKYIRHSATNEYYENGPHSGEQRAGYDLKRLLPELATAIGYYAGIPFDNVKRQLAFLFNKESD